MQWQPSSWLPKQKIVASRTDGRVKVPLLENSEKQVDDHEVKPNKLKAPTVVHGSGALSTGSQVYLNGKVPNA